MSSPPDRDGTFFYVLQNALKIIFVDDDPILREFALVNLTTEHATVATAADGVEALALLDGFRTRHHAPRPRDAESRRFSKCWNALSRSERWRGLPVIVVTGREDIVAVDRAFEGRRRLLRRPSR